MSKTLYFRKSVREPGTEEQKITVFIRHYLKSSCCVK